MKKYYVVVIMNSNGVKQEIGTLFANFDDAEIVAAHHFSLRRRDITPCTINVYELIDGQSHLVRSFR